jgi:hypothetical protein
VIQHEIGHCIGFYHTDYMVANACGGTGISPIVNPIHIPGTPTGNDPNSFMIQCIWGQNRTFNGNDIIAMNYLY